MAELGRLTAVFDADTRKFDAGVRGVGTKITGLTSTLGGLTSGGTSAIGTLSGLAGPFAIAAGGAVVAASAIGGVVTGLFELVKSSAKAGGELQDLSQKTGFAVETLSGLSIVAKTTGSDIQSITGSLVIFQKNMEAAGDVTSKQGKLFQGLNIDIHDNEKALRQVFVALGKMGEGAHQTAIATQFFGRSGAAVLAMIKETNGNLDEAIKKYGDMGLIISSSAAKASDKFNDTLEETELQLSAVTRSIGMELLPVATEALQSISRWLTENKGAWSSWGRTIADTIRGIKVVADSEIGAIIGMVVKLSVALSGVTSVIAGLSSLGEQEPSGSPYAGYGVLTDQGMRAAALAKARKGRGEGKVSPYNAAEETPLSGRGGGGGGRAKIAKDELAAYRQIVESTSQSLQFYGTTTEHARVEQEFLRAGIDKLSPSLKSQAEAYKRVALQIADNIDVKRELDDQAEKDKQAAEKLAQVTSDVNEAIFKQGQELSDLQSNYPSWLRQTYDFIVAKTKEGYSWSKETKEIYLNNEARREQLRVIAEGATRGRYAALPDYMKATGNETRERRASPEYKAMQEQIARVKEQMMGLGQDLTSVFSQSIGDGFDKGAKHGLATLAQGLLDIVENIFLKKLAEGLGNLLTNFMGGGKGGGWLEKILGIGIGAAAGGAGGGGGWKAFGANLGFPHATGLNYVPYDNYPALLHKGERVMTASDNKSGGGTVINQYINLPPAPRGSYVSPKSARQQADMVMAALRGAT